MYEPNTRLATSGIISELPAELIVQLWMSVDIQKNAGFELDYLQVFKFEKVGDSVLAIRHEQEVPPRQTVIYCDYRPEYEPILSRTVYIIDDGDHSTILFADEY